jgi:predicted permease
MRRFIRLRHWLRGVFRRRQLDRDLDDELFDWLETLEERHRARGLSLADARRAAVRELGGLDHVREEARAMRAQIGVETLFQDVRLAWRGLWRTPLFAAAVTLTFAVGIGANAAIFSVVKAVLIEPLPYPSADRLMFVWADVTDLGYPRAPLAGPELAALENESRSFVGFGGVWATTATLAGNGEPEQLRIATVTPRFFELLGVPAEHGTIIGPEHFGQTVQPVLLSHRLWQRRYGADPGVIGRRVTLNGRPAVVAGVMPATFRLLFPQDSAVPDDLDAWIPGGARPAAEPRGQQYLRVIGRLRPGVSTAEGAQEIATIGTAILRSAPEAYTPNYRFYGVAMQTDSVRAIRPALLAVFGGVSILLAIACVNIAGLLIARAASRRKDAAVRVALGASNGRLLRQYVAEGSILSLAGGTAGVLMSHVVLGPLISLAPPALSRVADARIDGGVLGFTAIVSVFWGLLFSLAPFVETLRIWPNGALGDGGRGGRGVVRQRTRRALVVVQVALGLVLLVGAALLARTFERLLAIDVGFDSERVQTFRLSLARLGPRDAQNAFARQLTETISALPGVESVGAISHLPYDNLPNWGTPYLPEGVVDRARAGLADARTVAPGFFETVRATLLSGRFFTEADDGRQAEFAVVIDDLFASRVWPGQDPVGKALTIDAVVRGTPTNPARVIGVVKHLRHRRLTDPGREQIFVSSRQAIRNPVAFVIRAGGDPDSTMRSVREAIRTLDANLPVYDVRPLDHYLSGARAASRFTLVLTTWFAASALLLAGIGVYGLIAYAVGTRRREFGVRIALGARPGQIVRQVTAEGGRLALAGIAIGTAAALAAARLLSGQLYEIGPHDPAAFAGAMATLALAALAACWLPARLAARSDPQQALRDD